TIAFFRAFSASPCGSAAPGAIMRWPRTGAFAAHLRLSWGALMPELSLSGLTAALDDFLDPALRQRFLDLDALQLELDGDTARVRLCLGYPAAGLQAELEAGIRQRLAGIAGLKTLDVKVES